MSNSLWPCELQPARLLCPSLSPGLLKLLSIESVMLFNHLILCHPHLLLPSVFPSIRVSVSWLFESGGQILEVYFQHLSFNEYSRLISFSMDWAQGALKSLLQYHSLKASVLWRSAFFMVQLSHPYMTTGKTITLTIQAFAGKVMNLLISTCYMNY